MHLNFGKLFLLEVKSVLYIVKSKFSTFCLYSDDRKGSSQKPCCCKKFHFSTPLQRKRETHLAVCIQGSNEKGNYVKHNHKLHGVSALYKLTSPFPRSVMLKAGLAATAVA